MNRRRFLAALGLLPFAPRIVEGLAAPTPEPALFDAMHQSGTMRIRCGTAANEGWWSLNGGPWEPIKPMTFNSCSFTGGHYTPVVGAEWRLGG